MGHSPFVNGTGDTGDFESARQPFRICGGNVGATPCCAEVAQLQSKPSCSRLSGVMRGRFGLNHPPEKKDVMEHREHSEVKQKDTLKVAVLLLDVFALHCP